MTNFNWQKQTLEKPLFEDVVWSKPENKLNAGRYLIVGGNTHEFINSALLYGSLLKAGAISIKLVMPVSLNKIIKDKSLDIYFLPATPSGSFSLKATAEILDLAHSSDITLISDDLGHNSETELMEEHFINKYRSKLCVIKDTIAVLENLDLEDFDFSNLLIIGEIKHFQKFLINKFNVLVKETEEQYLFIQKLSELTKKSKIKIITLKDNDLIVASNGKVSSTAIKIKDSNWTENICGYACYYLINNVDGYKALSSAVWEALSN